MSLYAEYLKERSKDEIIESDFGFATYRDLPDQDAVYIVDIYVSPKLRKDGLASKLADEISEFAKLKGRKKLLGSVVPSTNGSTISLKALLGYGMRLQSSTNDFILFEKDVI